MKINLLFLLGIGMSASVCGQTLTDGLMMPKKNLCTGFMYTHDSWTEYWEGELKRDNGNIGKVTTQSLMWVGNYGITNKSKCYRDASLHKNKSQHGNAAGHGRSSGFVCWV